VLSIAIAIAGLPRAAAARPVDLAAAVRAVDELRYEDAATLLERALHAGDNGPDDLALLFRLQGEVAATLGDTEGARAAFERLLAIRPAARLPDGTSPKIVALFDEARADQVGRELRVGYHAEEGRDPSLVVEVASDPLGLVDGARATFRGSDGVVGVIERRGGPRIQLPLPAAGRYEVTVAAIDRHGNRLLEITGAADAKTDAAIDAAPGDDEPFPLPDPHPAVDSSPPVEPRPLPEDPPRVDRPSGTPWYAHWATYGTLALVAGGAGTYFALRTVSLQDDLDALNADSENHSFQEAHQVENDLRAHALFTNVSFGAAGAFAIVSLVLLFTQRDDPSPSSTAARSHRTSITPGGFVWEVSW
jgi:hypothetical protein